ncbi:hypothetical protein ACUOA8_42440, partial [Escherichia sp. SS-MK2]
AQIRAPVGIFPKARDAHTLALSVLARTSLNIRRRSLVVICGSIARSKVLPFSSNGQR